MADKRQYAYYIKGNKIALIQIEDTVSTSAGDFNSEYGMYKSPFETIADGLEIQYAYSPDYFINETNDVDTNITNFMSTEGDLTIVDSPGSGSTNYGSYGITDDSYIVLRNAGRWNGLHRVKTKDAYDSGTNNLIRLYTKYSGSSSAIATGHAFEETVSLYYNVSSLTDESSEIDLPRYQANALVYYLKAKLAEDIGEMEQREFFMREFKRQLEKSTSALKRGPYVVQGFKEMRNG